jgi:hypothetical protein
MTLEWRGPVCPLVSERASERAGEEDRTDYYMGGRRRRFSMASSERTSERTSERVTAWLVDSVVVVVVVVVVAARRRGAVTSVFRCRSSFENDSYRSPTQALSSGGAARRLSGRPRTSIEELARRRRAQQTAIQRALSRSFGCSYSYSYPLLLLQFVT